jgi:hypothetical protein
LRGFNLLAEVIRGVQFKDGEPLDLLKETTTGCAEFFSTCFVFIPNIFKGMHY